MATERATRDAPVYDNDSFWWSAPLRENYLGLDRGPMPVTVAVAVAAGAPAAAAEAPERPIRRRRELPTRWAAHPAGW